MFPCSPEIKELKRKLEAAHNLKYMKNQLLERDDKRMNEKLEQLGVEKRLEEERKKEDEELMEKEGKERALKVAANRLEFLRIREVCTGFSQLHHNFIINSLHFHHNFITTS